MAPTRFRAHISREAAAQRRSGMLQFRIVMMDSLEQAVRGVGQLFHEALAGGNVWILAFVCLVGVGVITAIRGKLTESWLWIPLLALAMWYALYRWLEIPR
jgi:hypothetical protein